MLHSLEHFIDAVSPFLYECYKLAPPAINAVISVVFPISTANMIIQTIKKYILCFHLFSKNKFIIIGSLFVIFLIFTNK